MLDLFDAYLLITLAVLASMLLGGLVFAGGTTAPVAVRVLSEQGAASFLRAFWPRYYRAGVVGGAALTLTFGVLALDSPLGPAYSALLTLLAGLFTLCMWLSLRMIPAINRARDVGDLARFDRLHGTVLALTGIGLLFGLGFIVALGWVLPGQYPVWMQ